MRCCFCHGPLFDNILEPMVSFGALIPLAFQWGLDRNGNDSSGKSIFLFENRLTRQRRILYLDVQTKMKTVLKFKREASK